MGAGPRAQCPSGDLPGRAGAWDVSRSSYLAAERGFMRVEFTGRTIPPFKGSSPGFPSPLCSAGGFRGSEGALCPSLSGPGLPVSPPPPPAHSLSLRAPLTWTRIPTDSHASVRLHSASRQAAGHPLGGRSWPPSCSGLHSIPSAGEGPHGGYPSPADGHPSGCLCFWPLKGPQTFIHTHTHTHVSPLWADVL